MCEAHGLTHASRLFGWLRRKKTINTTGGEGKIKPLVAERIKRLAASPTNQN
jgi:hypothetical protein